MTTAAADEYLQEGVELIAPGERVGGGRMRPGCGTTGGGTEMEICPLRFSFQSSDC